MSFGTTFDLARYLNRKIMKPLKYLKMIRETTGTILTIKCPLQFEGKLDYRVIGWLQGWIAAHHPEFFILEIVDNVELDLLTT